MSKQASREQEAQIRNKKKDIDNLMTMGMQRRKGDCPPEIFFIGQIVGGSDFCMSANEGLFVEAYLNYGEDWVEY